MSLKLGRCLVLAVFTLVVGCATTTVDRHQESATNGRSTIGKDLGEEIARLEERLESRPNDATVNLALAEAYKAAFESSKDSRFRRSAIERYESALSLASPNRAIAIQLYSQLLGEIREVGSDSSAQASALFDSYPVFKETGFSSPEFSEALYLLQNRKSEKLAIESVYRAVARSPKHAGTYALLSDYHDFHGRQNLSGSILMQGLRVSPDDELLIDSAVEKLSERLFDSDCFAKNDVTLRRLTRVLAARVSSKNLKEDKETLGVLHHAAGRYRLWAALNESIHNAENSGESGVNLFDSYYMMGSWQKARQGLEDLEETGDNLVEVLESLAYIHLSLGEWSEASAYFQRFVRDRKGPVFYDVLYYAIAEHMLGENTRQEAFFNQYQDVASLDDWEASLLSYWTGSIDSVTLESRAENDCELSEAKSVIAFLNLAGGEGEKAAKLFDEVLALKVYNFVEYGLALYQRKYNRPREVPGSPGS